MVSIAKFFLEFTQEESCGKCVPCRIGTKVMLDKLEDITAGQGQEGDIELLEDLAEDIKNTSLCGLGQTAPNPVLTTIKYFRDEYEAHIKYKRCPAVVCKSIISSACQHTCPLGQDVSCYIGLIAQEKFDEAIKIVHKENPFPAICGRVCHHPCELKCRAGEVNEPIAIRSLKRFLADYEQGQGIKIEEKPKKKRAEKVAIIGSGPGGLTCAYYLALEGYQVTVFEALSVIGGMLRVGIPEYRLPKKILDYEIQRIKNLGVEIRTNTTIGKDIQLSELKNQGYKAIFIATGAHKGLKMGIPGEDTIGVIDAVDFLRQVNLGQRIEIGEKVMVIGGGNAAVDAARVAKRLGKEVRILYRRTRQEMPAAKEEVEATIQEGIPIDFLAAPVKINIANGKLKDIECIKMKLGDVDESGRRKPVPIEGSEFKIEIDTLIPAIGQQPDISFLNGNRIKVSRWNTIEVDAETFSTTEEGIFAGGDVVTGPKTVTEAMAAGKVAAKMMHKYLQGEEVKREYEVTRPAIHVEPVKLTVEELEKIEKKPSMPSLPVNERIDNFNEVELGYTREMAIQEAKRCLRCDYESTRS
jgi:NADH-quinone oxidoreductase subunit F